MSQQEKIMMVLFMALSALTSFATIFYGLSIITEGRSPHGIQVFAYVTAGYGLVNMMILSIAWSTRESWADAVSKLVCLSYLGVFIMDNVITGFRGPLQLVGVLLLALFLWTNWMAVKKVIARP